MKCSDCKFFLAWANNESGECTIKLPRWVRSSDQHHDHYINTPLHPVVWSRDGCDLGVKLEDQ